MDEKTKNDPGTSTEPAPAENDDSLHAENEIKENNETLENVKNESESFGSEATTPLNPVIDKPETADSIDPAHDDSGSEAEGPVEEHDHETLPSDTNGEDDTGTPEKQTKSSTAETETDWDGTDTLDGEEKETVRANFSASDKKEENPESSAPKADAEDIDEKQEYKSNADNDDITVQTQIGPETIDADEENSDLEQGKSIETPAKKRSALKVALSAVLVIAAFSGFFIFDDGSKVKPRSQKALDLPEKTEISQQRRKKSKINKPETAPIRSIYDAKLEEIAALRDRLLLKQEEIMRLKKHYQDGVAELENEISDELRKRQSTTFVQAMEDDAVVFGLQTIQRRQAYIQQLEGPARWIHQACEELLYIQRRTLMDLLVVEIAAGIDMEEHVRHIDAAVQKYQPTADKLALDMTSAELEPLEFIWNRIQNKSQPYTSARARSKNQIISEQICAGNFDRLSELSEISAETAKCITEMQASDLFLNRLAEISPAAARQLFQWTGSWVCLNGVRALSPRTALYLFRWDGNCISLNGLTEFPAEIGETLLDWDGRQLELMGLRYAEDFPARIALDYLARWERGGGKLFVPQSVRKKLDEIHKNRPNEYALRN